MKKRKKESTRYRYIVPIFSCVILVIALISTIINDWIQVVRNRNEIKEVNIKYEELKEEEASLNVEVAKLKDPDYIARYAREKYMYSKPGEIILRMVEPDDSECNNEANNTDNNG